MTRVLAVIEKKIDSKKFIATLFDDYNNQEKLAVDGRHYEIEIQNGIQFHEGEVLLIDVIEHNDFKLKGNATRFFRTGNPETIVWQ